MCVKTTTSTKHKKYKCKQINAHDTFLIYIRITRIFKKYCSCQPIKQVVGQISISDQFTRTLRVRDRVLTTTKKLLGKYPSLSLHVLSESEIEISQRNAAQIATESYRNHLLHTLNLRYSLQKSLSNQIQIIQI